MGPKVAWLNARTMMALVMMGVLAGAAAAQSNDPDKNPASGIVPSSFGDAVDREVMTIRDATAKFKTIRRSTLSIPKCWYTRSCLTAPFS